MIVIFCVVCSLSHRERGGVRALIDFLSVPWPSRHDGSGDRAVSGAVRFMGKYCQPGRLWWLSTDKGTTRSVVADIEKRITRLQLACDLPQHRVTVFEGSGGLHAHLIFTGAREIARRLEGSMAFGNILEVKPVTDPIGLVNISPRRAPPRPAIGGSTCSVAASGDLTGSTVVVIAFGSPKLSSSRRSPPATLWPGSAPTHGAPTSAKARLRGSGPLAWAPRPAGQLPLWPELDRRPVSKLREFGGGPDRATGGGDRDRVQAQAAWHVKRGLGRLIGRSQGQLANALRGHDPISRAAVNRNEIKGRKTVGRAEF